MSNSLNRASLDLVKLEADMIHGKKKKTRSKSVLDLIPTNHRIVKGIRKSDSSSITSRPYNKVRVLNDKKRLNQNKVSAEENIRRLLKLSGSQVDLDIADKLFNRAVEKRAIPRDCHPKEEEKTAFTEEDFTKFAEEYCNN